MSQTRLFSDKTLSTPSDIMRALYDAATNTYRAPVAAEEMKEYYRANYLVDPVARNEDFEAAWPNIWTLTRSEGSLDLSKYLCAFLDTGLMHKHPMLEGLIQPEEADFTGEGTEDLNGHGTEMALEYLMSAFARLRLVNVKVMPRSELGSEDALIKGLRWLVPFQKKLRPGEKLIANVSCGVYSTRFGVFPCRGNCRVCRTAIKVAAHGIQLFVAAGNEPGKTACPAMAGLLGRSPRIIASGAVGYGRGNITYTGKRTQRYYPVVMRQSVGELNALLQRGQAFLEEDRYAEALPSFERMTRINPTDVDGWFQLGYTLLQLKRFEDGLAATERALALDPSGTETWTNLSWALDELGRYEEGLTAANRALELDATNVMAWVDKGWALDGLGRFEEGIRAADRALTLDSENAHALNNKATALHALGRDEDVLETLQRALVLQPENAILWARKGATLTRLKRLDEALAAQDRALELNPSNVMAWFDKGTTLSDLRRHNDALVALNRAIELDPNLAPAFRARARVWEALGRPALAAVDWTLAQALEQG